MSLTPDLQDYSSAKKSIFLPHHHDYRIPREDSGTEQGILEKPLPLDLGPPPNNPIIMMYPRCNIGRPSSSWRNMEIRWRNWRQITKKGGEGWTFCGCSEFFSTFLVCEMSISY